MKNRLIKKRVIVPIFLAIAAPAIATPLMQQQPRPIQTEVRNSVLEKTPLTKADLQKKARIWGLTVEEYQHYQALMKNTPSRLWYKNLDPAEVLGMNANSKSQLMHYAREEVKLDATRIPHEIAYNNAFNGAAHEYYGNTKPIEWHPKNAYQNALSQLAFKQSATHHSSSAVLESGDRLILFIDTHKADSHDVTQKLLALLKKQSGMTLTIYVTNPLTDQALRAWAKHNHIPPRLVQNNTITLNHDQGQFKKAFGTTGRLPAVLLDRNNHFQQISLSSIL